MVWEENFRKMIDGEPSWDAIQAEATSQLTLATLEVAYQLAVRNENSTTICIDGVVQVTGQDHYPIAISKQGQ